LDYYGKFGNRDVWQKVLCVIASQTQESPPFYEGGRDPLISTFEAIESLKTKVCAHEVRFDLYFRPVYGPTGIMAGRHPRSRFDQLREGLGRTEGPPAPVEALKFDHANLNSIVWQPRSRRSLSLSLSRSFSPRASRELPRQSMVCSFHKLELQYL
jgi:hypothetical protein